MPTTILFPAEVRPPASPRTTGPKTGALETSPGGRSPQYGSPAIRRSYCPKSEAVYVAHVASSMTVTTNPAAVAICSSWLGEPLTVSPSINALRGAADAGVIPRTMTAATSANESVDPISRRTGALLTSRRMSLPLIHPDLGTTAGYVVRDTPAGFPLDQPCPKRLNVSWRNPGRAGAANSISHDSTGGRHRHDRVSHAGRARSGA